MRIAIIGAGPTGSWLAWKLSKLQENVTVIEREMRPGGKACSGLVSERIWDFIPRKSRLIQNKINEIAIHFPKKTIEVKFKQRMLVMDRGKLDAHVVRLAENAGARMTFGSTFKGLRKSEKMVRVEFRRNGKTRLEEFDRLIGCDGALSSVRRSLGLPEPRYRTGLQCFQPVRDSSHTAEAWPTRGGFFWRIPRGKNIEWGLFETCQRARGTWGVFANKNNLDGLAVQSAIIPEDAITTGNVKVALCGDAAGLTKPWSGGGLIWGLTSAKLLLDSWPDFGSYESAIRGKFVNRILLGRMVTRSVNVIGKSLPWVLPRSFDSDWLL